MTFKSRFIEMFGTVRDNTLSLPVQKMGDVVEIRNGRDYKVIQNDNGRYPVYGTGGIITYADDFLCPENTVIIGRKGTIDNPLLIKEKFWNVDTAFGMICNQLILNPIYYFWFCKQYDFKKHNKATTIPSLVKADLQKIDVIVPEKYKQDLFADFVKQVDKSKAICKQIFQSFDNLVKSRFIEMFGNDDGIKTKWHVQHFVNCCNILYGFPLNSSLFNDNCEGMPIIRVRDINTGFAGTYSTEVVDQKYIMKRGDLLVSMDGDFRAIFWNDDPAILNQRTCKIECEPIMNKLFLLFVIRNELDRIHISTSSTTVKHLSAKEINKMKLPVPPIELQNEFADFVEQVDKSKFEVVQSLLKLKDSMKSSQ